MMAGKGPTFVLTGVRQLDRKLASLSSKVVRKVASPAVNRALTVLKKGIQSEIPAQYKSAKKAIGKRFNKAKTGEQRGLVVAKVGAGVGADAKSRKVARTKKGGVGISARNIHWFILGTGKRKTKTGRNRGSMPAILAGCVERGVAKTEGQAFSLMIEVIRQRLATVAKQ